MPSIPRACRPVRFLRALTSVVLATAVTFTAPVMAHEFKLALRYITTIEIVGHPPALERRVREEKWPASKTAIIVCDVWDYHHCLNAVRRLEEFAPRLDAVLKEARRQGATIIHSPSDCMDAYVDHPARKRVRSLPLAPNLPQDIQHWCSRIRSEERAIYPIDQSDGGEDDDPREHAEWAAKLKALGRNPNMPWKQQSPLITIDADSDYISDRGDEVWSILKSRSTQRVILAGVHTNMCVLGRPFGLRQMVRAGKQVVLLRDMTDCMYNPSRWPYVDHFTGNDLVIAHVERYICPTITSDQLLGDKPFHFQGDRRPQRDVIQLAHDPRNAIPNNKHWTRISIPLTDNSLAEAADQPAAWFRCAVRLPTAWLAAGEITLSVAKPPGKITVWLNGELAKPTDSADHMTFKLPAKAIVPDDANLLVLRLEPATGSLAKPPMLTNGSNQLSLHGNWQVRLGNDESWSNMPLPARFGASPDILFESGEKQTSR